MAVVPRRKPTAASVWYFRKTAVPPTATETTMDIDQKAAKPSPAGDWARTQKEHITLMKEKNWGGGGGVWARDEGRRERVSRVCGMGGGGGYVAEMTLSLTRTTYQARAMNFPEVEKKVRIVNRLGFRVGMGGEGVRHFEDEAE